MEARHEALLALLRTEHRLKVSAAAEAIGISPATVRRDIAELAAKGLVKREHGFVLDTAGSVTGPGLSIGMLVPDLGYYFPKVIDGARAAISALDGNLTVTVTGYQGPGRDRAQIERLLSRDVDGLIMTPSFEELGRDDYAQWLHSLKVPVVLAERLLPPGSRLVDFDRVNSAHIDGLFLALRHLQSTGKNRIALAGRSDSPTAAALGVAWQRASELDPQLLEPIQLPHGSDDTPEQFEELVETILQKLSEGSLDGLIVHNDRDALILTQRILEAGFAVPGQLGIVAYDGEVAALADIPLTEVSPPKEHVGRMAAELLIDRIASGLTTPPRHVQLLPTLTVRQSTVSIS
ncbi:LacI family DNA-binding transcriptional regulator [Psychromicrobium xiongbiense]|uniref:LacI family DNA-binding transcriptional regulator n=1 Tax=Psychromicrobium xiongbiense TaxID=3051184 RepID=UPI0025549787|nr:substrate-binding domain-containing protein [Psychromicrobium sp. YIM S02556]